MPLKIHTVAFRALVSAISVVVTLVDRGHAQTTQVLTKSNDWTVYSHEGSSTRICFVTASPKSSEPKDTNRDAVHFYVSGWPRDGVKSEVSVKVGYTIKKGSEVTIAIGSSSFRLFAANDRAFIADPIEELKLIEALKKGTSMIVRATSERGTQTRDSYSLQGLTQALQSMVSSCTS